jgi:thiopeptide-type bacteriocin biosynthesis protein
MSISPSGFFVMRTPLLPVEAWLSLCEQDEVEPARQALRALVGDRVVREALFVGSPDLHASIGVWERQPGSDRGRRIERALRRYLSRMATRPTPFGLFAGVTLGGIGDRTRLAIAGRATYRRQTRLDGGYLDALAQRLALDPSLRSELRYRPNTSVYPAAGRMRYVEWRLRAKDADTGEPESAGDAGARRNELSRSYSLADVADTAYLRATLQRAREGEGATRAELATALAAPENGITLEQCTRFIDELIANQLLLPVLPLPITGDQPLAPLVSALHAQPVGTTGRAVAVTLAMVREGLSALDDEGTGVDPARYRALASMLSSLPAPVEIGRLFQVDLFKPAAQATLGRRVIEEITRGVELVRRVSPAPPDSLSRFRERFTERYEGREVPLAEVLDEESGIGLEESADPEPLLRTLDLGPGPARPSEVPWGERETTLLRLLSEALRDRAREIVLERESIDALEKASDPAPAPLPGAFAVVATIAAATAEAVDRGDFLVYLGGAEGPSGVRLLGRFCHGDDALRERVREHLRAEEALDPDAIHAEIVHSPAGRLGNVLLRPVLREHEIAYLGDSGAPRDRQLLVADLLVSVEGSRIILRSARDGRRVAPHLTSAHNHMMRTNLATYRFLCALEGQGTSRGARWDWGALRSAPFLPRVRAGRLVLSLARWHVPRDEIRALDGLEDAARAEAVREWRERRDLPQRVGLADADNVLLLDLETTQGVDALVHLARDREAGVLLQELFPEPDALFAEGPEGRFTHELIVPFVKAVAAGAPAPGQPARRAEVRVPSPVIPRRFAPHSEWMYAKIYCGSATADRVLRRVVAPLVRRARAEGWIDRWFFIRYADPAMHVRLRFHGAPDVLRGALLPALAERVAPLLGDGSSWRLQLDTYEREVERYGGDAGIELAEALFEADSDAVTEILEGAPGLSRDDRWRVALCGIDALLTDLGFDVPARRTIVGGARDALRREHRTGANLGRQIGGRFRAERQTLEALLSGDASASPPAVRASLDALHRRSERLAPIAAELRARDAAGRLTTPLAEMAPSITHMFAVRLLRSTARLQETVLYDMLARLYEARAARRAGMAALPGALGAELPAGRATAGEPA